MNVTAIDHVNLRIPEDGVDDALDFYGDRLGFERENFRLYERDEKPFFSFRMTETSVLHVRPIDNFERPGGQNYDHVALLVGGPIEAVKRHLTNAGIDLRRESEPLGATGVAPAVYVRDPFGYHIEIKVNRD